VWACCKDDSPTPCATFGQGASSNQAQLLNQGQKYLSSRWVRSRVLRYVQSTMMVERTLKRAATAPMPGPSIFTPPPATHPPNHSRTDRSFGFHSREMDHMIAELRNRHLSAPNLSTTADHHSSTESEETLTPTSSDDREETQGTILFDRNAEFEEGNNLKKFLHRKRPLRQHGAASLPECLVLPLFKRTPKSTRKLKTREDVAE